MALGVKSVGRVGVRVLPDSTSLRRDLQKVLDRIERTVDLNLNVVADTSNARKEARDFKRDVEKDEVTANLDLDTAVARTRLAVLQRPRQVPINVSVTTRSLAKAATAIAALSGARVVNTYLTRMRDTLQNLDRSVPAITGVMLAVSSLGSVALSAGGGLFTVGAGIAQAATAALALPGILGGVAIGVGTLVVALAGAGNYIGDLADGWKALGPIIQDNFWGQAADNVRALSDSVLPALNTELAGTAQSLGNWAAALSDGLAASFTPEVFASMFGNLNASIEIAAGSTGNFASILAGLGQVGASYLPRLAQWVADITTQFDAFIAKSIASGDIFTWIDNGIVALKQIGSVLASTGSILSGINNAAVAAGGGGLATLADVMGRIATVVNGPAFQGTLTTIFQGAAAGAQGLALALGPIGDMFVQLAPLISTTLATLGPLVGQVLGTIADALSSPAIQGGFTALVDGVVAGVTALLPAVQPLADMLGALMQVAGPLAGVIGGVLGAALTALAPVVTSVLEAIAPVIPLLGEALMQAVTALTPLLTMIGQSFAQIMQQLMPLIEPLLTPLVRLFQELVPVAMSLFSALMPIVSDVLTALVPILGEVLAAFTPLLSEILPPLTGLFQQMAPIIAQLMDAVMALITPILEMIKPMLELIGPILKPLIDLLVMLTTAALKPIQPVLKALMPVFEGVGQIISSVLVPAVKMITDVLGGLITFLTGVFTGDWSKAWDGIVQIFSGIWNGIKDMAKAALNGLIDIVNGMIGGVNSITGKVGIPKIPSIPKLAQGGIVQSGTGGTVALIGEGRHDEAVIPLGGPQFQRLAAALAAQSGTGGGGMTQVTVQNDINMIERDPTLVGKQIGRGIEGVLVG
ncbi:hypothetical protein ACFWHR_03865 [Leucobacter sp. NPDC058333]|uniref:phage tail protein n=1 Tax=Leucobacter sp. NPDC058333 TaxID=3346450 RepID=UPI003669E4A1